ncbi:MAG: hypothetical protein K2Q28_13360 [Hyphomicrobium sp.]|nr:hypothetical protein [Hyphomicrobium sp.]
MPLDSPARQFVPRSEPVGFGPPGGKFRPLWGPIQEVDAVVPCEDPLMVAAADAYRKGYEDGQANAEATFAITLERERRHLEYEMQHSQHAQLVSAVQALSQQIAEQVILAGAQIGDNLARALVPSLTHKLITLEHDALVQAINRVLDVRGLAIVTVSGPESFVPVLADLLETRGLRVTRDVREQVELIVSADDLELRSSLPRWIAQLEAIFR